MRSIAAGAPAIAEIEIKKSRFIGVLARCETEIAAREHIGRTTKAYRGARHYCTAYILDQGSAQPVLRSNDDGEPSGTAGMPMLDVLVGAELVNVALVVVRYFGGIKLGTGGLGRAYGGAAMAAIEAAHLVERRLLSAFSLTLSWEDAARIEAELRRLGIRISSMQASTDSHDTRASLELACAEKSVTQLEEVVARRGSGNWDLRSIQPIWEEVPLSAKPAVRAGDKP